jgi:hypothetical protein
MAYPPNGFNWNWTDLPSSASLSDVISTVNWIGQNLDANYTNWIENNNSDMYTNVEQAKSDASDAAADAAQALAATGKINRCSYLRGTH